MTVWEAWKLLGKDPQVIMGILQGSPSPQGKAQVAKDILEIARKLAKKLMAKNHPDLNQDDPTAINRFKQIQAAISTIEINTEEFQHKVKRVIEHKKDNVVIVIK